MTILHFTPLLGKEVTFHCDNRIVTGVLVNLVVENYQIFFHVNVNNDIDILSANHYTVMGVKDVDNIIDKHNKFLVQEDYYRKVTEEVLTIRQSKVITMYDQLLDIVKLKDGSFDLPMLVSYISALNNMFINDVGNSEGVEIKDEVVLLLKSMLPDSKEDRELNELYQEKVEERKDDSESFF